MNNNIKSQQCLILSTKLILGLLLLLLLGACGGEEDASSNSNSRSEDLDQSAVEPSAVNPSTTIVAMGDSLTEGLGVDPEMAYPAQLEERLRSDGYSVSVINAGVSGETSSGALSRVDWILNLDPDVVILTTGANDGLRGIDPALTFDNIDSIVETLLAQDITVVLGGMQIVQNMGSTYVEEFRAVYPRIAEKHDVIHIPFFLDKVAGDMSLNQPDEVHPTAAGYTVIVDTIYAYVEEAILQ